jgi:hypothetical protein
VFKNGPVQHSRSITSAISSASCWRLPWAGSRSAGRLATVRRAFAGRGGHGLDNQFRFHYVAFLMSSLRINSWAWYNDTVGRKQFGQMKVEQRCSRIALRSGSLCEGKRDRSDELGE